MSYALIIPPEFLEKLVRFRECFKESIRSQIMEAIESYIEATEADMMEKMF